MSTERPTPCCDTPVIFFHGQYSFRSLNSATGVLVTLIPSAAFIFTAASFPWSFTSVAVILFTLLFGGIGIRMLWGFIHKECTYVEINKQGIIRGKHFWPWEEIQLFQGTSCDNGVCLGLMLRKITWGSGKLPTTPLLTNNQYIKLAKELSHYLATEYPDVIVAPQPKRELS